MPLGCSLAFTLPNAPLLANLKLDRISTKFWMPRLIAQLELITSKLMPAMELVSRKTTPLGSGSVLRWTNARRKLAGMYLWLALPVDQMKVETCPVVVATGLRLGQSGRTFGEQPMTYRRLGAAS